MISHKNEFIFIQIPKTACTSCQSALGEASLQGRKYWYSPYFKHITLKEISNDLPKKTVDEYFKFSFVRNPYDWLVSNYFFCRGIHAPYVKRYMAPRLPKHKITLYKDIPHDEINAMDFKEWVKWYVDNIYGTQLELIEDKSGKVSLDFIGRFENLQEDLNVICDKIGIPKKKLPHHREPALVLSNQTKHAHYTEYYDDETKEIVAEKYAKDIQYLGYEFRGVR